MRHYRHSGAVPLLGVLIALAVALLSSILGVLYAYLVVWIPLIYVSFFISVGFGALLGLAAGYAARLGKIRNTRVVSILGVLAVVPAYYTSWVFDPLARLGLEDGGVIVDPRGVLAWMSWLYQNGSWGLAGVETVKGPLLAGVWIVEAGIIAVAHALCAAAMIAERPFCEMCQSWTRTQQDLRRLSLEGAKPGALELLASGNIDGLFDMPIARDSESEYLRVDLAYCPTCRDFSVLTVQMASTVVDKHGKSSVKTVPLIKNLMISAAETTRIQAAARVRTRDDSSADVQPSQAHVPTESVERDQATTVVRRQPPVPADEHSEIPSARDRDV